MSDNKNSGVDTTPQGPGAGVVSCALGTNLVFIEWMLNINFKDGSFHWKLKLLVLVLRVKSDRRASDKIWNSYFFKNSSKVR